MTFLNTLFLWLLPVAAVPLIIHLLNRSKVKQVKFPTLRFLQPATKRILKRFKFLQWLLLLMRILVILFLTFAFARPVWKGYTGEREVLYNIILIDNSYSMEYRHGKSCAFELSRELALQLVRDLDGQFAVGIINRGLESMGSFSDKKNEIMEEINSIKISARSTDLLRGVKEAVSVIESELNPGIMKNVIVLSDFNEDGFNKSGEMISSEDANFLFIDTSDGEKNLWLEDVRTPAAYSGIPVKIKGALNNSNIDAVETKVSINIGGEKKNRKNIKIVKKDEIEFRYTFEAPGSYYGFMEIEDITKHDRIDADNTYYFNVKVEPRIKVLVVDGDPGYTHMGGESYFILRALSPGNYDTPLIPRVINPDELRTIRLDEYRVMFLLNVDLDREISEKVMGFSSDRKGVGIFLGDNVDYSEYNRLFDSLIPVDITSPEPVRTGPADWEISKRFSKEFSSASIRLNRAFETLSSYGAKPDITAGNMPVLWVYSPGAVMKGKVALFTSTADMQWTDFPVRPSYPALIQKLALMLSSAEEDAAGSIAIGDAVPEEMDTGKADIVSKSKMRPDPEDKLMKIPGNYMTGTGRNRKIYSVNVRADSGESGLAPLKGQEVRQYFKGGTANYIPYSENLKQEIIKAITGQEKSHIFLLAAFMLLATEEMLRKYLQAHEG
ncbi:BatA domain-containing protein [Elusimicrobiota bacterium]